MLLLSLALLGAPLPGEDGDGAMVPHSLERVSDKCHPDNRNWRCGSYCPVAQFCPQSPAVVAGAE